MLLFPLSVWLALACLVVALVVGVGWGLDDDGRPRSVRALVGAFVFLALAIFSLALL